MLSWFGSRSLCESMGYLSCKGFLVYLYYFYFNENFKCNCDTFPGQRLDEGILSNIEHLPVREVAFGGSSSQFRQGFLLNFQLFRLFPFLPRMILRSFINFKIGHLKCEGKSPFVPFPDELEEIDYFFNFELELHGG